MYGRMHLWKKLLSRRPRPNALFIGQSITPIPMAGVINAAKPIPWRSLPELRRRELLSERLPVEVRALPLGQSAAEGRALFTTA
jgi:hypothetical protein